MKNNVKKIKCFKKIKYIKNIKNIKKNNKHIFQKKSLIKKKIIITKKILKNMNIKCCLNLVKELNNPLNNNIMNNCYFNIFKISKLFPPAKNENKFIYGKLIELELIKTFNKNMICNDLDSNHKYGSEYKNDCTINGNNFSIKASKNGNSVTIINKLHKNTYNIDTNFIIIHIKNRKLYIFPTEIINKELIKDNNSNILFKSSIFNYLDTHYDEFIYKFPELNNKQNEIINNIKEVNIYNYLYYNFIKNYLK